MFGLLRHKLTGKCVSVESEKTLSMTVCNNSCNQLWKIRDSAVPASKLMTPLESEKSLQSSLLTQRRGKLKPPSAGKLLCWVLTQPLMHETRARAVKETWGKDCDTLLFITTEESDFLQTVVLDLGEAESRNTLWLKSQNAWMYMYQNYIDKADW